MNPNSKRWKVFQPSAFPWERDALDFIREGVDDFEPWRVYTNFEFSASDGSLNEVDALIVAPAGVFLVEIKSRPGKLAGDASTWEWTHEGRTRVDDNPLYLADKKSKRLRSLLEGALNSARRGSSARFPFINPLVFCSSSGLGVQLTKEGRAWIVGRDPKPGVVPAPNALPGILAVLRGLAEPGAAMRGPAVTADVARLMDQAFELAQVKPSRRLQRVGDYELGKLLEDGDGFQDFRATQAGLSGSPRRVRIYGTLGVSEERREELRRAARREALLLQSVEHPGILRVLHHMESARGPALFFELHEKSQRLDHYLKEHGSTLATWDRLSLLRRIAEALAYAHDRRLFHRALSPRHILVTDPTASSPAIRIHSWQTGAREAVRTSQHVSGTEHLERWADAYLAPETALDRPDDDFALRDVYSLGILAYTLFAGRPPADRRDELRARFAEGGVVSLAAVVDGIPHALEDLVRRATEPRVLDRLPTMSAFLECLEAVEEEVTRPDVPQLDFDKLSPGTVLDGGFVVKRKLGSGATAHAYLAERAKKTVVLKIALSLEKNDSLAAEAAALRGLRHARIVELLETRMFDGRQALVLSGAGEKTLADRLTEEGNLSLDRFQLFGEDLLDAVLHLEETGVAHRDIKPSNLGISESGKSQHLVLFDFSLAGTPHSSVGAGTPPYLDPFLVVRKKWDLHAERFAAAMTLYEMATGTFPRWGDGTNDPVSTSEEIVLEPALFDSSVREGLVRFFTRCFARNALARFDNAGDMRTAFRKAVEPAGKPLTDPGLSKEETRKLQEQAKADTNVAALGLTARAVDALERAGIRDVATLLSNPLGRFEHLRGAGRESRREIRDLWNGLVELHPNLAMGGSPRVRRGKKVAEEAGEAVESPVFSVEELADSLPGREKKDEGKNPVRAIRLLLGLEPLSDGGDFPWPFQKTVAEALGITAANITRYLDRAVSRWAKRPQVTKVREELHGFVLSQGGVVLPREAATYLLELHGSARLAPFRTMAATALVRAAVEVERQQPAPRFNQNRESGRIFLSVTEGLSKLAAKLGGRAEALARQTPLPGPARVREVLEELRPTELPEGVLLSAGRLVGLAAAASDSAVISPRGELYPRGLAAREAVGLAAGSVLGATRLGDNGVRDALPPRELRERLRARFPEAEELPPTDAALADLLASAGVPLEWDGRAFRLRSPSLAGVSTETRTRPGVVEPALEDVAVFENWLRRAHEDGAYRLVVAPVDTAEAVATRLSERLGIPLVSLEARLLSAMRAILLERKGGWEVAIAADAAPPGSDDGQRLRALAREAVDRVEKEISADGRTLLLTRLGLLARYDRLDFLARLRAHAVAPGRGLVALVPGSVSNTAPVLDGRAIPVLTPNEWRPLPEGYLERSTGA